MYVLSVGFVLSWWFPMVSVHNNICRPSVRPVAQFGYSAYWWGWLRLLRSFFLLVWGSAKEQCDIFWIIFNQCTNPLCVKSSGNQIKPDILRIHGIEIYVLFKDCVFKSKEHFHWQYQVKNEHACPRQKKRIFLEFLKIWLWNSLPA